eukprot:4015885-Lingulodinium_polyedra.AAC.1
MRWASVGARAVTREPPVLQARGERPPRVISNTLFRAPAREPPLKRTGQPYWRLARDCVKGVRDG